VDELLARFVAAFQRGIEGEVTAMRASASTYETPLAGGRELGGLRYVFEVPGGERLVPGAVAVLRTSSGDQTATIERVVPELVLVATSAIELGAPVALLVAPWFLYERMVTALERLAPAQHGIALALMLFGRVPPQREVTALHRDHAELDASQRAAVQLCSDASLAFVWGPPGTGKTVTVTHVIEELVAQGKRILLVSTTNAAIDEVLAKLSTRAWFTELVASDHAIRLGRSTAETYGTELAEVVARRSDATTSARTRLRARLEEVERQAQHGTALAAELAAAVSPQQSLFGEQQRVPASAFGRVFGDDLGAVIARRAPREQVVALEARLARLTRLRTLAKQRLSAYAAADRGREAKVVAEARLVMCTLTNAYLSPLMVDQRFDVLIAEEAGMATLPALFYAAALCRERAIMVGDPRQLPPIVQSDDDRVRRAIGRSIFDVTVPEPVGSPLVAMLETQYRMHPAIGAIVSRLFYADRLVHRADPITIAAITARAPFPGEAVAIVDTAGATTCERSTKGSSRVNHGSAARVVDLADEAVRAGHATIAVITPYAAQAGEIRKLLGARRIRDAVECATIHRFQGRECDVVILDLVDAAPLRPSALLADTPNLLNVAISRARGKLVIVADVAWFSNHDLVRTLLHDHAIRG